MRAPPSPAARPDRVSRCAVPALALALLAAASGCAASPRLEPLDDPLEQARRAARETSPERPYHVTLSWEYADERGAVEGDGVLRFNPPDSVRLDLLSSAGDASMQVALVPGSGLRTTGRIEDVRLPPPAFLYASAGLFRPGHDRPTEALGGEGAVTVLVYEHGSGGTLRFRFEGRRLVQVEERRDGRSVRRSRLTWPDSAATWPAEAEYRDRALERRARWRLGEARAVDEPFPPEIYDLPSAQ